MADSVGFDDLVEEIVTERAKGATPSKKFVDAHTKSLRESWDALNAWIGFNMAKRKGVHLPQLCRMTWEFMADPATGNVRVRPVFVLTEAFIRGLRLANARKPELPETTAPCQDVNYSKIAIKFSKSLTKVRTAEGASEQASISSE